MYVQVVVLQKKNCLKISSPSIQNEIAVPEYYVLSSVFAKQKKKYFLQ